MRWDWDWAEQEKKRFNGNLVWSPDFCMTELVDQFLVAAIEKGVYSSEPKIEYPVRKDKNGVEIPFNYIANEEDLLKIFERS